MMFSSSSRTFTKSRSWYLHGIILMQYYKQLAFLIFNFKVLTFKRGWRVTGISGFQIWSKTLMELIFNPCGEFRWSPEGPVSQIHSPYFLAGGPGIFSDFLKSVHMLKREWGAEGNGKLPHLFIPSKPATLVPEFAVKDLPLSRTLWWWWWWWWWSLKMIALWCNS